MELRVESGKSSLDPFAFALAFAQEFASKCDHPFGAAELWTELTRTGVYFEDSGKRLPEGETTVPLGVLTAGLALDHLFTQRLIRRNLAPNGDYVYGGTT
jgi:hypothetical protein